MIEPPDVKFEIGHVLFIDVVGYSKLVATGLTVPPSISKP